MYRKYTILISCKIDGLGVGSLSQSIETCSGKIGNQGNMVNERLSVAPMVEWTDPHFRMLLRGITKKTVLYTEMVVDETVLHNPSALDFEVGKFIEEEPSVIQLGGNDPEILSKAAEICDQYGGNYGEINLNCGCPSKRVAKRCFGAKLMLDPEHVRKVVYSMQRCVNVPVTVKCRIGVDDIDSYDDLTTFIKCAAQGGSKKFIIHARKCLLNGLTTKQNRNIPPLHYEVVHKLVNDFPDLVFVLNGGIQSLDQARMHVGMYRNDEEKSTFIEQGFFPQVNGVMIGRAAYNNPLLLATADSQLFEVKDPCLTRREIIERYIKYCEWCQSEEGPRRNINGRRQIVTTSVLINSMRNVINGIKNVQKYRTALNDIYIEKINGINGTPNPSPREVIEGALEELDEKDLDQPLGNCTFNEDKIWG